MSARGRKCKKHWRQKNHGKPHSDHHVIEILSKTVSKVATTGSAKMRLRRSFKCQQEGESVKNTDARKNHGKSHSDHADIEIVSKTVSGKLIFRRSFKCQQEGESVKNTDARKITGNHIRITMSSRYCQKRSPKLPQRVQQKCVSGAVLNVSKREKV